jgi:hypothetical protein
MKLANAFIVFVGLFLGFIPSVFMLIWLVSLL